MLPAGLPPTTLWWRKISAASHLQLQLVDPADRMARELERCLKETRQISRRSEPGTLEIYTTADPQEYIRAARRAGLEGVITAQSWPGYETGEETEKEEKGRLRRRPFLLRTALDKLVYKS